MISYRLKYTRTNQMFSEKNEDSYMRRLMVWWEEKLDAFSFDGKKVHEKQWFGSYREAVDHLERNEKRGLWKDWQEERSERQREGWRCWVCWPPAWTAPLTDSVISCQLLQASPTGLLSSVRPQFQPAVPYTPQTHTHSHTKALFSLRPSCQKEHS